MRQGGRPVSGHLAIKTGRNGRDPGGGTETDFSKQVCVPRFPTPPLGYPEVDSPSMRQDIYVDRALETVTERPDIKCPKTGDLIPLHKFSCSKWSDELYFIHCPACYAWHGFMPTAGLPPSS